MISVSLNIPTWLLWLAGDLAGLILVLFLLRDLLRRLLARRSRLYLAGRGRSRREFDVLGIFSSRELAEKACTRPADFYLPLVLDKRLPDDPVAADEVVFPLSKKARSV